LANNTNNTLLGVLFVEKSVVDNNLESTDVNSVIDELSSTVRSGSKELHVVHDSSGIPTLCPASVRE